MIRMIFSPSSRSLFDFTTLENLDDWHESSDTVREGGMSKANLVLQKTRVFQRAVFFTLLNPQPNGAGFAGMRTLVNLDLRGYSRISLVCRGQGQNFHYKVVLRHRGKHSSEDYEYEHMFEVPKTFAEVDLQLDDFKAYWRGKEMPTAEPLDLQHITMFGLQVYGGVYLSYKQSGVSALEIEKIVSKT